MAARKKVNKKVNKSKPDPRVGLRPKPGSRITLEQMADVGGTFARLVEEGRGTAAELVREASSPKSPAHKHFEWDDEKAAHRYRVDQARHYIRSIEVVVESIDSEPLRAWWPVTRTGHYQRVDRVVEDEDLLKALIEQARRDLVVWSRRYEQLRRIGALKGIVDEVLDKTG